MKDVMICCRSLSTGYETICKGVDARAAADSISGIVLDIAGYGSVFMAIFDTALTALCAYADITGTAPVYGCYEDFLQVKINYDISTKYTYADLGYGDGYRLGAVTQKVRIIDIEVLQYYAEYNGGREVSVHRLLNETRSTQNFYEPAQKAVANIYTPWVERINAEIYHHPIIFLAKTKNPIHLSFAVEQSFAEMGGRKYKIKDILLSEFMRRLLNE